MGELDNCTEVPFRKERKMLWTDSDNERKNNPTLVQEKSKRIW